MSTYQPRHAAADHAASPQRRLLVRGAMATAVAAGAGVLAPQSAFAARATLRRGSRGEEVRKLQAQLLRMRYWHSGTDGVFGASTEQAVMAVQKAYGLPRTGICDAATWRVVGSLRPVRARTTSGTCIEVDLTRQLLIIVINGRVGWTFNTSTGKASTPTPRGRWRLERQINGMRHAPLGDLWRPKYWWRGYAIHGATSIPGYPASSGCARVSYGAMNYIWKSGIAPLGRPLWVY